MGYAAQGSDAAVASLVRLLIIDEVHLLNDERGAVIETLVSRTQRQVLPIEPTVLKELCKNGDKAACPKTTARVSCRGALRTSLA